MTWNPGLTKLRGLLAYLYPTIDLSRQVVDLAGMPIGQIPFTSAATSNWHAILREAQRRKKVQAIVAVARQRFPERAGELAEAEQEYLRWMEPPEPGLGPLIELRMSLDRVAPFVRDHGGKRYIYGTATSAEGATVYGEGQRLSVTMENRSQVPVIVQKVDLSVKAHEWASPEAHAYDVRESSLPRLTLPLTEYAEPVLLSDATGPGSRIPVSYERFGLKPRGSLEAQHTLKFAVAAQSSGLWRYVVLATYGSADGIQENLESASEPLWIVKV